ncbi:ferritin-like domain-containing protein [Tsukamurella sp. 1534]|uniref:ferritin-like domain-containing protein n=1 Tax=Tsukamurella sp. 1534 TaxID=1151061 RepID=UPI0002ECBCE5|nr:ferritin-like domain-containing protein [Tsukamurella sp. 1534]
MTPSQEAVGAAIRAEHAAIYLYGVVDAYASPARKSDIATMTAEHRAQRDSLIAVLTAASVEVPAAAPGYTPPKPVADPVSAAELAAALEDDCAAAHRNLLSQGDGDGVRHLGVTGLGGAATRGARWRVALGVTPVGPPFPGIRT